MVPNDWSPPLQNSAKLVVKVARYYVVGSVLIHSCFFRCRSLITPLSLSFVRISLISLPFHSHLSIMVSHGTLVASLLDGLRLRGRPLMKTLTRWQDTSRMHSNHAANCSEKTLGRNPPNMATRGCEREPFCSMYLLTSARKYSSCAPWPCQSQICSKSHINTPYRKSGSGGRRPCIPPDWPSPQLTFALLMQSGNWPLQEGSARLQIITQVCK